MQKEQLKEQLTQALAGIAPKDATPQQLHQAIGDVVMHNIAENWNKSTQAHETSRHACYFSMEFLVGRAVFNNLLCLGCYKEVESTLQEMGASLASLEEIEDAALGNGGLGRLAACFLDSAATLNLPLDGYGIRYKYGLFKQSIVDGFQKEEPDNWMQYGDAWSVRCEKDAVLVHFNGQTVKAVPYDMPVIGCKTKHIGTLRLWQAEPVQTFDFDLFNQQKYLEASAETVYAEDISRVLYPNDDTWDGKKLRLKQQYFFCAASLSDILKKHKATYGTLDNLADKLAVQLNDTHPVISIPELIRLLMLDDSKRTFADAFAIAQKVFRYTNHTVMPEALGLPSGRRTAAGTLSDYRTNQRSYADRTLSEEYSAGTDCKDEDDSEWHGAHGTSGSLCILLHQRCCCNPHPDSERYCSGRLVQGMAGTLPERNQRHYPAALAGTLQPGTVRTAHRTGWL